MERCGSEVSVAGGWDYRAIRRVKSSKVGFGRDTIQETCAHAKTPLHLRFEPTIGTSSIKVIAFDTFAIFDPRPIFARAEKLFPGHAAALSDLWRSRQFEYAWLRSLSRDYTDLWQVNEESLRFAAKFLKLEIR